MRRSVHGLMDSLKPPALDAFGLMHALHDGPLRDMVERAGMRYGFRFLGETALIDALREDTQIAIWRIAQEAATNAVRHARANRFEGRLRVGIRGEMFCAILDLRDDGVGMDATADPSRRGEGLQGMHDRVLALDGVLRTRTSTGGTRLHVLLRQAV
jgi:two-component system sensor histidine kinase UhpB